MAGRLSATSTLSAHDNIAPPAAATISALRRGKSYFAPLCATRQTGPLRWPRKVERADRVSPEKRF